MQQATLASGFSADVGKPRQFQAVFHADLSQQLSRPYEYLDPSPILLFAQQVQQAINHEYSHQIL